MLYKLFKIYKISFANILNIEENCSVPVVTPNSTQGKWKPTVHWGEKVESYIFATCSKGVWIFNSVQKILFKAMRPIRIFKAIVTSRLSDHIMNTKCQKPNFTQHRMKIKFSRAPFCFQLLNSKYIIKKTRKLMLAHENISRNMLVFIQLFSYDSSIQKLENLSISLSYWLILDKEILQNLTI